MARLRNIPSSARAEPQFLAGPSAPLTDHFSESPFQSLSFLPNYIPQAGIPQAGAFPVRSPDAFPERRLSCHGWDQGSQLISSM